MEAIKHMSRPSSTITAAGLAGMGMSIAWGTINEFTPVAISPGYIALTVTFVSSIVGYMKPERVLKPEDLG